MSHVCVDAHQSKEKVPDLLELGLQAVVHVFGGGARNQKSPLEKHQVFFTHQATSNPFLQPEILWSWNMHNTPFTGSSKNERQHKSKTPRTKSSLCGHLRNAD